MLEADVHEVADRTVGILGLGRIGQAVAARLAPFELRRLAYADVVGAPREIERQFGLERLEIDELCRVSDAVTVHAPLLPSTRGLLDARRLALMSPKTVIINAARGPIIDEAALCEALDAGRLRGAALDVFSVEPLPMDSPLRGRPNVLLSPHLAGSTNEARGRMVASALRNLDRVLRGGAPENVVNGVDGVPRRDRG
jgi:phosphoglycerate dehydrogenase-like enzyme